MRKWSAAWRTLTSPSEEGRSRLDRSAGEGRPVLVRVPGSPDIYVISGGSKLRVPSMEAFHDLGYELSWVQLVSAEVLAAIPDAGPPPFDNTIVANYQQWQNWDWSRRGEEWSFSEEWKQALIDEVLLRHIGRDGTVLEIGPGGGRWTAVLAQISRRLIVVDLTERAIEVCRTRFEGAHNIEYFVNDGRSLPFIEEETVDYAWSFDVFVHVAPQDIDSYMSEFARAFAPGAIGVIHHAREGGQHGGLRSAVTSELFAELAQKHGLTVVRQFDRWGNDGQFDLDVHRDAITVFQK